MVDPTLETEVTGLFQEDAALFHATVPALNTRPFNVLWNHALPAKDVLKEVQRRPLSQGSNVNFHLLDVVPVRQHVLPSKKDNASKQWNQGK